jgi:hypothetical protein
VKDLDLIIIGTNPGAAEVFSPDWRFSLAFSGRQTAGMRTTRHRAAKNPSAALGRRQQRRAEAAIGGARRNTPPPIIFDGLAGYVLSLGLELV